MGNTRANSTSANFKPSAPVQKAANDVEAADLELGTALAKKRDEPAVKAAASFSEFGDQGPLYSMAAAVVLIALLTWNPRLGRAGVTMGAAVGATDILKRRVKKLVKRTRPHVLLDEGRYESEEGGSPKKPEQSFPSGHTACTVAATCALARVYPKSAPVTGVAACVVALARVAKGAHWPLDVLAGVILGLISEQLTSRLFRALLK